MAERYERCRTLEAVGEVFLDAVGEFFASPRLPDTERLQRIREEYAAADAAYNRVLDGVLDRIEVVR